MNTEKIKEQIKKLNGSVKVTRKFEKEVEMNVKDYISIVNGETEFYMIQYKKNNCPFIKIKEVEN